MWLCGCFFRGFSVSVILGFLLLPYTGEHKKKSESDPNTPKIDHRLCFIWGLLNWATLEFPAWANASFIQLPWRVTCLVNEISSGVMKKQFKGQATMCQSFAELSIFSIYCHSRISLTLSFIFHICMSYCRVVLTFCLLGYSLNDNVYLWEKKPKFNLFII